MQPIYAADTAAWDYALQYEVPPATQRAEIYTNNSFRQCNVIHGI